MWIIALTDYSIYLIPGIVEIFSALTLCLGVCKYSQRNYCEYGREKSNWLAYVATS